ncbi:MAG: type II restriction endonuclease [Kiritimatiellia bacterium]|jgi:hypothetical protein
MTFKYGVLADYFDGIGFKRLKPVEIDPESSNGHEFHGVTIFREILGTERKRFQTRMIYLCDSEGEILEDRPELTWYDARERHPTRSEFRLYYKNSVCIDKARPEDLMVLCVNKAKDEETRTLTVLIAKHGDTIESQLAWLFGIELAGVTERGMVQHENDRPVNFYMEIILERIGISLLDDDDALLSRLVEKFNGRFPSTASFSAFAREVVPEVNCKDDVDGAVSAWMESEERAFRCLERHIVKHRIEQGFTRVEDFIDFSLSVQNRRKSRAGHALENHLRHLFQTLGIRYSHNQITENRSRPDFLFPGIKEYRDPGFPTLSLSMLGVKTSCKERWRQVLSEAQRLSKKHLLTLEPGISTTQTDEMRSFSLQLVVPRQIFDSYTSRQQSWLMSISDFTQHVKTLQD